MKDKVAHKQSSRDVKLTQGINESCVTQITQKYCESSILRPIQVVIDGKGGLHINTKKSWH